MIKGSENNVSAGTAINKKSKDGRSSIKGKDEEMEKMLELQATQGLKLINSMVGNDQEVVIDIIETFLNESSEKQKRLKEAIGNCDIQRIQRDSHALKSIISNLGLSYVYELTATIEKTAILEQLESIYSMFNELEYSLDIFRNSLQIEIDKTLANL